MSAVVNIESVLTLAAEAVFERDGEKVMARITRGAATTTYSLDQLSHDFLMRFREPVSLGEVAEQMSTEGYSRQNVLDFGVAMMRTPLLQLAVSNDMVPSAVDVLQVMGYRLLRAFKDKKFDGVYHVLDCHGEERVIKLSKLASGSGRYADDLALRLRNEYQNLKEMQCHHGIVPVLDFSLSPYPCFAMMFLHGEKLTSYLCGRLTLRHRLQLCQQIVALIEAMHGCHIVHGDVHTSNFMVGPGNQVTLIDLDCSFKMGTCAPQRIGGAAHFIPPERTTGLWFEAITAVPTYASDVYQLGVVLYFVLVGRPPFRGQTFRELSQAIRDGRHKPATHSAEGEPVPKMITARIEQMLAQDPRSRITNLGEVMEEMRTLVEKEHVTCTVA
ncbi:MAG: serine/threonine protein kinase [Pseudomonadota bacterium]